MADIHSQLLLEISASEIYDKLWEITCKGVRVK